MYCSFVNETATVTVPLSLFVEKMCTYFSNCGRSQTSVLQRRDLMQLLDAYGGNTAAYLKQELNEFSAFTLGVPSSADIITRPYRHVLFL